MNIWPKYKSPLGYYNNDDQIDSYGVDHSGFGTRDELNYQMARQKREDAMMQCYNNQGITSNYPQYTTNFWGKSADNNYGFGVSNISNNISNQQLSISSPNPDTVSLTLSKQKPSEQIFGAIKDMSRNYYDMKTDNTVGGDDYFHCKANYEAAQRGKYGALTAQFLGNEKEIFDYFKNRFYKGLSFPDALADYWHDKDVNEQGRKLVKHPLYSTAKGACSYQRVNGINEKY